MGISGKNQRVARKLSKNSSPTGLAEATATIQAERDLLLDVLKTLSQSRQMEEYLGRIVGQIKKYADCCCVGIRILDDNGNIPYTFFTGFSRAFYMSESPLSINSDRCMCINVIKGNTDPELPFYTEGGSFLSNATTKMLASVPVEIKGQTRNVCNQYGYESVALVPMRRKDKIVGLIHLADNNEDKFPIEKVRFLEQVGAYIGEAMHAFIAEEMLRESENRYRDLYEEAPNAYFSLGINGHIERANRRATELFGYNLDELVGQTIFALYTDSPDGKPKAQEIFHRFHDGKEVRNEELEMCRANGSKIWVSLSLRPICDKEGRVVASRLVVVDITERKKLDQLKDEFIGLVSHELRSPLTVITGAVNTALTELERLSLEETRQLLKDASVEAGSLSHMLWNLLELSRMQADRLCLNAEATAVRKVIQNTVEEIKSQSSAHRFIVDLPKKLPPVYADELRLERILYNLLDNAVKYSPEGGDIRVSVKLEDGHLVIGVRDQGIGISNVDQTRLFQPFQRLEDYRLSGVKGAGLGLLVCRRLVEAHHGRIWVTSKLGQGSTFFFTIPLNYS